MAVTIEQIAQAALDSESLLLRSLTQDFLQQKLRLSEYRLPKTEDRLLLAAAAALIELFAMRLQQNPPDWTSRPPNLF